MGARLGSAPQLIAQEPAAALARPEPGGHRGFVTGTLLHPTASLLSLTRVPLLLGDRLPTSQFTTTQMSPSQTASAHPGGSPHLVSPSPRNESHQRNFFLGNGEVTSRCRPSYRTRIFCPNLVTGLLASYQNTFFSEKQFQQSADTRNIERCGFTNLRCS